MKNSLIVFVLLIFISGCASVETVKNAQGQGEKRTYEFAYEKVYSATLQAAKEKKLQVIEKNKSTGQVILSHGVTWWSWGERIALFISPVDSKTTQVEIVSKPVMAPLNFPPDWQGILLEQIHLELIRK